MADSSDEEPGASKMPSAAAPATASKKRAAKSAKKTAAKKKATASPVMRVDSSDEEGAHQPLQSARHWSERISDSSDDEEAAKIMPPAKRAMSPSLLEGACRLVVDCVRFPPRRTPGRCGSPRRDAPPPPIGQYRALLS